VVCKHACPQQVNEQKIGRPQNLKEHDQSSDKRAPRYPSFRKKDSPQQAPATHQEISEISCLQMKSIIATSLLIVTMSLLARADDSTKVKLAVNQELSFGGSSSDIAWKGSELVPVGHAQLFSLGRHGARIFKAIHARSASTVKYSATPIPSALLVPGEIFGVRTNQGAYAKVMVAAMEGDSLALEYVTFAPRASKNAAFLGPPAFILAVQNNYSYLLPGLPNYGIAPGSIFVIEGENLSNTETPVLQSSAAPGLPLTLDQASLSVTVNGVTTTPALYYVSSNGIAAVLPSTTPLGSGVLTLTSNGQTAQAPIQVVATALGLDTLAGNGAGSAVATDVNFNLIGLLHSAMPGQVITLWGSGIGADTSNDDRTYPQKQNNLTTVPFQIYIGGISATVLYRGRSAYPGLDQINVAVPSTVTPGCFVSVVAQSDLVVSNSVTIPVNASGGACQDALLGLTGTQLQALASKGTPPNTLAVVLSEQTGLSGKVMDAAAVYPISITGGFLGAGDFFASQGSCVVYEPGLPFPFQAVLDPGAIQVTGPAGNVSLESNGGASFANFPSGSLLNPGTYTFSGAGGKDIGAFQLKLPAPTAIALASTNFQSIDRTQGLVIKWTGGAPGGDVMVNAVGQSPNGGSLNIYCHASASGGQLTIPPSALLAFPLDLASLSSPPGRLPKSSRPPASISAWRPR
jgi:uncharacterized protein (TIGR03437 family)